jgi:hypothetical protein
MPVTRFTITLKGARVSDLFDSHPKVKSAESKKTHQQDRLPDVEIKDDLMRLDDDGGFIPPDAD